MTWAELETFVIGWELDVVKSITDCFRLILITENCSLQMTWFLHYSNSLQKKHKFINNASTIFVLYDNKIVFLSTSSSAYSFVTAIQRSISSTKRNATRELEIKITKEIKEEKCSQYVHFTRFKLLLHTFNIDSCKSLQQKTHEQSFQTMKFL